MCGRYTQKTPQRIIEDDLELQALLEEGIEPHYNITKSHYGWVVPSEKPRQLRQMRWDFLPAWADDMKKYKSQINARAEDLLEKPFFQDAFRQRRCLVLGDGFYEWKKTPTGKHPMYIHATNDQFITFAGIWEMRPNAHEQSEPTFAIVTTEPNALVTGIHDRMPVILFGKDRERWLDTAAPLEELQALLRPCPAEMLTAHRVSKKVNTTTNDGPELIAPYFEGMDDVAGAQLSFF